MTVSECISFFWHGLLCLMGLSFWDFGKCPNAETSNLVLFRYRKINVCLHVLNICLHVLNMYSVYMYARQGHDDSSFTLRYRKVSEFWCMLLFRPKPMCPVPCHTNACLISLCFSTFEFHSGSSARWLRVSDNFCTIGFGVL